MEKQNEETSTNYLSYAIWYDAWCIVDDMSLYTGKNKVW